jgi:hypothetical protein
LRSQISDMEFVRRQNHIDCDTKHRRAGPSRPKNSSRCSPIVRKRCGATMKSPLQITIRMRRSKYTRGPVIDREYSQSDAIKERTAVISLNSNSVQKVHRSRYSFEYSDLPCERPSICHSALLLVCHGSLESRTAIGAFVAASSAPRTASLPFRHRPPELWPVRRNGSQGRQLVIGLE